MPQNSADATDLHFLLLAFCFPWKVSCYQHTPVKRPKYCIVNRDSIGKAGFLILTLDVDFPSYSRSTEALRSVPGWLGPLMSSLPSQELSKRMHYTGMSAPQKHRGVPWLSMPGSCFCAHRSDMQSISQGKKARRAWERVQWFYANAAPALEWKHHPWGRIPHPSRAPQY